MTLPTDLAGLLYWYRCDSLTLNGTAVVAALDQSGTGDPNKNAQQGTANLRPAFTAIDPLYNNQPTMQSSGAQRLVSGAFITAIAQPTTRFVVGHCTNAAGTYFLDSTNGFALAAVLDQFGTNVAANDGTGLVSTVGTLNNPSIIVVIDNGASSSVAVNQITAQQTGNAGTNGATGVTLGNNASGSLANASIAEIFAFSRILSQTEIAQMAGYLQQRYGIAFAGSTVPATLAGPTLADLVLAAQQRADRVNAGTIPTQEWYSMVNKSAQELYATLVSTHEDYNVKSYDFSLVGGGEGFNQLVVGPNTLVKDFFQPRAVWLKLNGLPQPFVMIPRLESFQERNRYTFPNVVPVYGAIPSRWNLLGNVLEILPPSVAGANYRLWYVPVLPTLVLPTDSIAQFWLSVNGWDEYITIDVARKALIKEESLDTAQLLLQDKMQLRERILREAAPRDISQPRAIADMASVRNPWGGWGSGGLPGPGWGADGSGGGVW